MPKVLIRIDAAGERPVVVDDDEALPANGVRWRNVADVETRAESNAVRSARLLSLRRVRA